MGIVVNFNLWFFYGALLTTIFNVIRSLDSSSIHKTMVMNTFNGAFWFVYGSAKYDYVWAVPNGIEVLLGVIQYVLCVMFPIETNDQKPGNDADNEDLRAKLKESHRMSIIIRPRDKHSHLVVVDVETEALEEGDDESNGSSDYVEALEEEFLEPSVSSNRHARFEKRP